MCEFFGCDYCVLLYYKHVMSCRGYYKHDMQHLLKMEPIQCSETSVFNTQTPGKYPEDNLS